MNKNYTVFFIFCLFFVHLLVPENSHAQPGYLWARQSGGSLTDAGKSVAVDLVGNVYTAGTFQGVVDFDPSTATYNMAATGVDVFITKTDTAGQFVWARKMGGTGNDGINDIAVDVYGNVYTTGNFVNSADFDPGAPVYTLAAAGNTDIFISKLTTSGDFIWARKIGGSDYDYGMSLSIDFAGDLYTSGYFRGTGDFNPSAIGVYNLVSAGGYDVYVVKINSLGDYIWAKNMGGPGSDFSSSLAADNGGNVVVTGWFEGVADFDPSVSTARNLTSAGQYDVFVCKLDVFGNYIWSRGMGGANSDEANTIALDALGNACVAGWFGGTADFDPGPSNYPMTSTGGTDVFIARLDASGNFVWAKQMGGSADETATSVFIDAGNSIYTTGYFSGSGDYNPSAAIHTLNSGGLNDIFISKLNSLGGFVWAASMGGIGADHGNSIAVDPIDAFVYVTGKFQATADFNPLTGFFNLTSNGGDDVFLVKLCQRAPDAPLVIYGNDTICEGSDQVYSIDPVADALSYTWILPNGTTAAGKSTSIMVNLDSVSGNLIVRANNDCGSSSTAMFLTVNRSPDVQCTAPLDTVCMMSMAFALSGLPAGGLFTGPGITGNDFHPPAAGPGLQRVTYTVMDSNECSNTDTLEIFVDICVGVDFPDPVSDSFRGYPNPAHHSFTIENNSNGLSVSLAIDRVEIYNVPGQKVFSAKPTEGERNQFILDVSQLPAGIYFVKVIRAGEMTAIRMIKN